MAAIHKRVKNGWSCCDTVLAVLSVLCLIAAIVCVFTVLPKCLRKAPSEEYYNRHPNPPYWFPSYHYDDYSYALVDEPVEPDAYAPGYETDGTMGEEPQHHYPEGQQYEPDMDTGYDYYDGADYYWDGDVIEAMCHITYIQYMPEPMECVEGPSGEWCEADRYPAEYMDKKRKRRDAGSDPVFRCGTVGVMYNDGGQWRNGSLHADVDQEDTFPNCTFNSCYDDQYYNDQLIDQYYDPLNQAMTQEASITCYYFNTRPEVCYLEEPKPFTWYTSAGFHTVFWPALMSVILVLVLIIKKLVYIAKHRDNGEKSNAVAPPPAYQPDLYVVTNQGFVPDDKKVPISEGPVVEPSGPAMPQTIVVDQKLSTA